MKPSDEFVNARLDLCLRIVTKQPARFGDVSKSLRHITRLQRLSINLRRLPQLFLEQRNEFAQFTVRDSPRLITS